jgi:hypothetical protein
MKKVIDGKMYNTDTATAIANWDNGYGRGDFKWCDEDLFVTKKGAYFVWGQGGALSRWSESCSDGERGGSGIKVLTANEAREWCETHDVDADFIAEHFKVEEA